MKIYNLVALFTLVKLCLVWSDKHLPPCLYLVCHSGSAFPLHPPSAYPWLSIVAKSLPILVSCTLIYFLSVPPLVRPCLFKCLSNQIPPHLYVSLFFSGETDHGGVSDSEVCACRQQPYNILLWWVSSWSSVLLISSVLQIWQFVKANLFVNRSSDSSYCSLEFWLAYIFLAGFLSPN